MEPTPRTNPDIFSRQPFKAAFILYTSARVLLLVPWWVVTNLSPAWRARPSWNMSRVLAVKITQVFVHLMFRTASFDMGSPDPEVMALDEKNGLVWIGPKPDTLVDALKEAAKLNDVGPARVAGYWQGKRDPAGKVGQLAESDEKVVYEILGGAFIMGTASPKGMSGKICENFLRHFRGFPRAFLVELRKSRGPPLPKQNAFPAAILDVLAGYEYLVKDVGFKPENILLAGESSGANLALAALRAIRDHPSLGLRPPGGLLLTSPAIDWGRSGFGPHSSILSCWDTDYIHPVLGLYAIKSLLGSLPLTEASTNPYISPASLRLAKPEGMFRDFPPTYLIVGDAEMLVDETRVLRDRLVADIGEDKVTYREIIDGVHTSLAAQGNPEELEETLRLMAKWVADVFD